MKIFLVNLDHDIKRLDFMDKQLKNLWLVYERFPAIKPSKLDSLDKYYNKDDSIKKHGKPLANGEIWCALSHLFIYKKMLDEDIDKCLILEDDSILTNKLINLIDKIEWNNYNYEYLTFSYTIFDFFGLKDFCRVVFYQSKNNFTQFIFGIFIKIPAAFWIAIIEWFIFKFSSLFNFFILKSYRNLYLTSGYVITKKWAKKILKVTGGKAVYPSDIMQNIAKKQEKLLIYCTTPPLVLQNLSFDSNIEHERI